MKVILFGATGMVGQGVLRECLLDPDVEKVLSVSRSSLGAPHDKLEEVLHSDFADLTSIEDKLSGYDACFFCLGVSSAGMNEADYTKVTYDYPLAAARSLLRASPSIQFVYVSGAGTDSSEKGRSMWARVKGKAENALLALPFQAAFMFRPAFIQPQHGIRSKTALYRGFYAVMGPLFPVAKALAPKYVITSEQVAKAMLAVAKRGAPSRVLENHEIVALVEAQ